MDHPSKRRRLAPKLPDPPPSQPAVSPAQAQPSPAYTSEQPAQIQYAQQYPAHEPAPVPERHEFEAFARHLQDAAMLIYRQTQRSPYTSVSVLLLRWEDDPSVEKDVAELEAVFRDHLNYHTERWNIPTVHNPSIKLGVQMASFLDNARADHLLIIYYAGHGYVGPDNHLYWACHKGEDAAKVKWDGLRCLFEDAQSDMLLLLDTCAPREAPIAGSNGIKQAIAAYTFDQAPREPPARSFSSCLAESFAKLATGPAFSLQRLREEVVLAQQKDVTERHLTNGSARPPTGQDSRPVLFTLTSGKGQGISMPILPPANGKRKASDAPEAEADYRASHEDQLIGPEAVADLLFDEARALVCTTFVGDASQDMAFFNNWLQNSSPMGSRITVEGMFLGPPTMLLVSMPHSVWSVVQHDKVCCFLGHITSHNMTHLYDRLVGSAVSAAASSRSHQDGRILTDARKATANLPALLRHDGTGQGPAPPNGKPFSPETPIRVRGGGPRHELPSAPSSAVHTARSALKQSPMAAALKGSTSVANVRDSAEMQEAAEQLKALSHRGLGADGKSATSLHTLLPDEGNRSSIDESGEEALITADGELHTPSKAKPRRSLQKLTTPKNETKCPMCTQPPFKDASSLRKHIAAAHTRPFPCAFSFAGCGSTFGSKNEWKRHISSQHLCLQYYRCSSCPLSAIEGKGNEFNRKDLFTQHLRRMHAPFAIKKSIKGDMKLEAEWDTYVKEMHASCLVTRRSPPHRSACPKPGCQTSFEGPTSWDEWTEHVGRHMEKGDGQRIGVDMLLAKWALEEGIIERKGDDTYRLCNQDEIPNRKDSGIASASPLQPLRVEESPKHESPNLEESPSKVESPEKMESPKEDLYKEGSPKEGSPKEGSPKEGSPKPVFPKTGDDGSIVVAASAPNGDEMDLDD